ncbi:ankyrin repeat-containing protein C6C3.08-like [Neltuma alba]|uniref:ankyrin repeat-containing protein C6C3.08-like n=1 Tax=Neltuma alba TaxID=207710 RepID=UPI0010A35EE1|nr:ankyrin repeat-containing protein C6C3.08-like [Prosopis alba]
MGKWFKHNGGPRNVAEISSQTVFIETPLHISASYGHHEFTKALLSRKPELALERNCLRSTPLHLASAEGHTDTVKQLLEAGKEACLVGDQEGRIPLHYEVIRGRRDVALELIRAKPESVRLHDDNGKNIFRLCVMPKLGET